MEGFRFRFSSLIYICFVMLYWETINVDAESIFERSIAEAKSVGWDLFIMDDLSL